MPYQTLILGSPAAFIAEVRLNRPAAANALNRQMGKELTAVFKAFAQKNNNTRAVVLTGEGKHFCAGADLKERKGMTKKAWQAQHAAFESALFAILSCPIPVIAAVDGAAMGGGLELALACDFIYASTAARFALPEVSLGIIPGMGGTQTLPRAVGIRQAKEKLFSARPFSAEEAFRLGLVNRLCLPKTLTQESMEMATIIAANAPLSVRAAKKAVQEGMGLPLRKALACELLHYELLLDTKDRKEGIAAFNEKRKPVFTSS